MIFIPIPLHRKVLQASYCTHLLVNDILQTGLTNIVECQPLLGALPLSLTMGMGFESPPSIVALLSAVRVGVAASRLLFLLLVLALLAALVLRVVVLCMFCLNSMFMCIPLILHVRVVLIVFCILQHVCFLLFSRPLSFQYGQPPYQDSGFQRV